MARKTAFLKYVHRVIAAALMVIAICFTCGGLERSRAAVSSAPFASSSDARGVYVRTFRTEACPIEAISGPAPIDDPWKDNEEIEPADLAKELSTGQKPIVLQVGFFPLFRLSHIPGAIYAGPANSAEGLDKLAKAVQDLPKSSEVVLYCGCCPFKDCPNVRPAFKALKDMGLAKIKVLMLTNNFTQDWVNKGYPVEGAVPPHKSSGARAVSTASPYLALDSSNSSARCCFQIAGSE